MRSDMDEHDLYPPDAENDELTPDAKHHRMRAAVGATLLVWGTSLMIQLGLGVDLDTFMLGLGIGALAGWSQVRRYSWFVAGAIATGIGAAEVVGALAGGMFGSTIASLAIAAGFAAIYVRYPRRSMWALVPAGIMALVAAGAFGVGLIGLLPDVLGRFTLPLLLVSGGGLLLFRHSLPPRTVKIGLAAIAVMFVLVAANRVPDIEHKDHIQIRGNAPEPGLRVPESTTLPDLDGRTLVIMGDSGDLEFKVSDTDRVVVTEAPRGGLRFLQRAPIREERDRVLLDSSDNDLVVSLPPGVEVEVVRDSGSVTGTLRGVRGTIRTGSGDVDLDLQDGGPEGVDGDGPLDIETRSGSVTLESALRVDLDLAGEGDVIVNGENSNGRFRSPVDTTGVDVEVDAGSGDISIDMPPAA